MLDPPGVALHWLEPPDSNRDIASDNRKPVEASVPLTLKANEWNQLELALRAGRVNITLNGQVILDQPYDAENLWLALWSLPQLSAQRCPRSAGIASSIP